jgi:hypothetical protein
VDNIIGRAAQGTKLLPLEKSFLEENYPANFLDNELSKRMPSAPKGAKPSKTFQIGEQVKRAAAEAAEAAKAARAADREEKLAAHAKNRQDLNDLFQADKQQKLAGHARNRQDLKDLFDADKQQKLADYATNRENIQAAKLAEREQRIAAENLAKAERKKAERVQAVLTSNRQPQGQREVFQSFAPAAEQAEEVVRKAPISKRTMEKMMSSNMLAAGVAAGGLGLIYASNRMRAEREVGR